MRHKNTKAMLNYWLELFHAANPNRQHEDEPFMWPERGDLQPSACRDLLGEMFILEEVAGTGVYRLAGTKLCSMFGREMKQENFVQTFEAADRKLAGEWISSMGRDDYLVLLCSSGQTAQGLSINLETLLMPLMQHGRRNTRVLGITVPGKNPGWLGTTPVVSQRIRSVRVIRPWEKNAFKANWPFEVPKQLSESQRSVGMDTPALFVENDDEADTYTLGRGLAAGLDGRRVAHLTVFEGGKQ